MSEAPLILPMNVSACVFSNASDTLEIQTMNYADGLNQFISPEPPVLFDPPARFIDRFLHQRGITVMWSTPYALRAGQQPEEGELRFQPLPNRWLIVRTNTAENSGACASKAWVVASDYLENHSSELTAERGIRWAMPEIEDTQFRATLLGAAMEIENFTELGAAARGAMEPLAVNSAGTEFFVSSEPFARNVYSFRDPLTGIYDENAAFTYTVMGWYDDPTIDPIAGLATAANGDVAKFIVDLAEAEKWVPNTTLEAVPPTAVYFGTVNSVAWTPDEQPANEAPSREDVLVIVGQSVDQTLDTMLEYAAGEDAAPFAKELERLGLKFSAGLSDILNNFEDLGGLSRQADEEHQAGFSKLRNETIWSIIEPQRVDGEDEAYVRIPEAIRGSLAALNAKEAQKFQRLENIQAMIGAVADTLWKAGRLKFMGEGVFPSALGDMATYWEKIRRELGYFGITDEDTLAGALNAEIGRVAALETDAIALVGTIEADLAELSGDFTLQANSGGRHWGAVDPVLMLTTNEGSLLPERGDPLYLGEDGMRIGLAVPSDQLISLDIDGTPTDVTMAQIYGMLAWQDGDPSALLASQSPTIAPWVQSLLGWSLLGDPTIGPAALEAATGTSTTIEPLRDAMSSAGDATGLIFDYRTNERWQQPWFPLYMEWRVHLTHFPLFKQTERSNWQFDGRDYALTATANGDGTNLVIQGRTMISSHVRETIGDALNHALSDMGVSETDVNKIIADLGDWNFLTQRVSGLGETLSLREGELKPIGFAQAMAPIGDADAGTVPTPAPWDLAANYDTLPGVRNLSLPSSMDEWNPNNTSKFRDMSGQQMVIDQLVIYDRYGQTLHVAGKFDYEDTGRVLTPQNMVVADSLAAEHNMTLEHVRSPQVVVQVPPRVLQPIRTELDVVDASVSETGDLETLENPICGFVTLNRYNKEIQIFDALGSLLGAIHPGLGDQIVFEPLATAITGLAGLQDIDADLFGFVSAIVNEGRRGPFEETFNLLDAAGWRIDPGSEREAYLSVLSGEVLALYRAQVSFQSAGEAIRNPFRFFPFEDGIEGNGLPSYSDQEFPFLLGDAMDLDDGLVGYFLDGQYSKLYTPYGAPDAPLTSYVRQVDGANAPSHSFTAPPRSVVVLANPHGHVQMRTGIAPAGYLALGPQHWRGQLALMNPSLSLGPLFTEYETDEAGEVSNILLPQSNIQDGHLHWRAEGERTIPVSRLDPLSGATTRPKAFLWGRVIFDRHFNSDTEGE